MIVALAGRRIDAPEADPPRFPASNAGLVESRVRELLRERGARLLVASAACGADLIAHNVARSLSLRRVMVLPFPPSVFRERSVVDRGGEWGPLFDDLLADAHAHGNEVIELDASQDSAASYAAYQLANEAILDRAIALAKSEEMAVVSVIVWDGRPRSDEDLTNAFGDSARKRGLDPVLVSTLV